MNRYVKNVNLNDLEKIIIIAKKEGYKVTSRKKGYYKIYGKNGWNIYNDLKGKVDISKFTPGVYSNYISFDYNNFKSVNDSLIYYKTI